MVTRILTASPANHAATERHGFSVIGLKQLRRKQALDVEPGDRFVLYLTQVQRFAGAIRVTGGMYEDRAPLWPGKPGAADAYPWRFPTEPEVVLGEEAWLDAGPLAPRLEHVRKWPAEHWKLAFQGQVRPVSDADAELLLAELRAAS